MPLADQLEEQAKRKLAEIEEQKLREAEKDQVFRQINDDVGLHDLDSQERKTDRHQAILKQHFAQELEKEGKSVEYEKVKADFEDRDAKKVTDSIDRLPTKIKRKWRIW